MFPVLPTTPTEFKRGILSESINSLKLNTFFDNYDAERFSFDDVDRSKSFNTEKRVYWLSWFFDNYESLYSAFSLFKTERSKRLFLNLLAFRIAGHHSVRISTCFDENSPSFKNYQSIEKFTASDLPAVGAFGNLRHYDFIYDKKRYVADCLGFKYYLFRGQYFYTDGEVCIEPSEGDFVIDAGACLGDTAIVFGKAVGENGKVFAFDPVQNHLEVLEHNINQNPDCNIQAMPFGLSDADVDCPPIELQTYSPGFSSRNQNVPLRCLDSLVMTGDIPKIDFVKMDIEGAELSAIKGAASSIRKFKPKLAISLYHKPTDIFEIPLYISKEFSFYEMFIEHYTIHEEETVLYCTPK
jgi:FkbM family methyltransferase